MCPSDHCCLDSNPVSKGNVFASSFLPITFTLHIHLGLPRLRLDLAPIKILTSFYMVLLGVKFSSLSVSSAYVWYITSLQVACLHLKSKQGLYTAMFVFFIQKYQHKAKSWESSIPRIHRATNKPDEQTWCLLKTNMSAIKQTWYLAVVLCCCDVINNRQMLT